MALAAQVAASCQGRVCAFLLRCRLCKKHAVERRQHTRVTSAANLELGREEAAQKKRALARWQPECKRGRFSSPGSVYVVKVNRWHNSAMHAPQGRAAQPGTGPITSITCCRELRNSIASTFGCGKVASGWCLLELLALLQSIDTFPDMLQPIGNNVPRGESSA